MILSTLLASWLAMQAVHESGHALGAALTGGRVARVVLNPLTISRTDLADNPRPLAVAWAGPVFGALLPPALWAVAAALRVPGAFVLRFFAGFCLIANGAYLAGGSFARVGDCGALLSHGAAVWELWLFGAVAVPAGLWLWHGQGRYFGLGRDGEPVGAGVTAAALVTFVLLLALARAVGGE